MNDLEFVGDYRQPQLSARQRALGHDGSSAGDFTFGDFLDIINPLQHIPVISNIYRALTGDEISPHARILGDTLFGGPTGFLASIANVLYEEVAGEDLGETAVALFTGGDGEEAAPDLAGDNDIVFPAAAPLETAAGVEAPPAEPGAVLPEIAPGMLTGQDALDALFLDLRGQGRDAAAMPLPDRAREGPVAKSYPLPPRHVRVPADPEPVTQAAVTHAPVTHAPVTQAGAPAAPAVPGVTDTVNPLLFAQETAGGAVADRMMQALDKYQAMARQNAAGRRDEREPRQDRPLWQADPAAAP